MAYMKYALCCSTFLYSLSLQAQETGENSASVSTFGGVGLLEMRNARFFDDGTLSIGAGIVDGSKNYYANWQATPWLETTLRFTDYNDDTLGIDKSVDVKVRLLEEGKIRPALAIGLQDFLGDGLLSGEYFVASKKIWNFDITAGFGFGNFANRAQVSNIAKIFGSSFDTRSFDNPNSEKLRFSNYFSGDKMGFFWGLEYKTPVDGVTAKIEYSTSDKAQLNGFQDYESKTAFNFGINYKVKEWMEINGGLLHGNQFSLNITLKNNLHKPIKLRIAKGLKPVEIRSRSIRNNALTVTDYKTKEDKDFIFDRLKRMGFVITSLEVIGSSVRVELNPLTENPRSDKLLLGALLNDYREVYIEFEGINKTLSASRSSLNGKMALKEYKESAFFIKENLNYALDDSDKAKLSNQINEVLNENELLVDKILLDKDKITVIKDTGPYIETAKNIGRVSRVLSNVVPDNVERFKIVTKDKGIVLNNISVLRKDFENLANYTSSPEEILSNTKFEEPVDPKAKNLQFSSSRYDYGIVPEVISHFGSVKDDHFKADFNFLAFGSVKLLDNLRIFAEAKQHIIGNLDLVPASTNLNVPSVRSDIGRYAKEGTTSLRRFAAEYIENPAQYIFTRVTTGILEEMYTGVSGEVLYSHYNSSLSFGFDINYVKQRGFNQLFSLRDYQTVTGHLSAYYINKKYDITTKVSVGRYLAKDWGTTIDISRQFNNGIKIGALATFTNMSQSDFGAGSFDKGLYMTIPFDFFWFKQSRRKATFRFQRLGKNGGQKIQHNRMLFDTVSQNQEHRIRNNWQSVME